MKKLFLFLLLVPMISFGQEFNDFFEDKTLRIDYIFGGNDKVQFACVDQLSELPLWAGRKHHLSESPLDGNGQIKVYDIETEKCIYKTTFSSLFQEWLVTPEASQVNRSFENTFLIPYPKQKSKVELTFRENDGTYKTILSHVVDPKDILIRKKGYANITPYIRVGTENIDLAKKINVAIVAEGFREEEMGKFTEYANSTIQALLEHKPFNKYKDHFDFYIVESISEDTGVSVPRQNEWKNTSVGSHFDTFYSDRYLTTSEIKKLHDLLAGIPYEHIIILANTDVYGGGGIYNSYTLTTTGHENFAPVVVHEFGHSFAGLADEYFYDDDVFDDTYNKNVEPWEQNITTLTNFSSKWKKLLDQTTPIPTPINENSPEIGVYEGAGYSSKGIYRGSVNCRMKTNEAKEFCPVCQESITQLIKFYID